MFVITKARGLRACDMSRPGDLAVLDFYAEGRYLVVDAVVTSVYRNAIISKATPVPDCVAKQAKDRKFSADRKSSQPIAAIHGGPHVLLPFAVEDRWRTPRSPCSRPLESLGDCSP